MRLETQEKSGSKIDLWMNETYKITQVLLNQPQGKTQMY